ncbi:DNA-binding GntR family transcriptional regulator [Methylobacterium brachiatum]|uniref:DNA-binding GntR family transcriptional regulator n=1 Tax=Methylobacterium brachiatum TaxID=269660 RepID=A0AAJ1WXJ9_9HYPH|nr:GntR family transcriptional regulator [Methylobacterium brachiatum]MCB4806432.1 GntR family transcriptional regulator [Methylobacterium brachiatum]MDQ0546674.1 DNA-binding GntR family transcriptional regulator [Methylobacterium brachiatum]
MQSLEPSTSLVDQAYNVILDALCDGTFKPGERLTQDDIAARLSVSRQPVTHALAVLKAQGFLMQSGRRGLTVTAVEPEFFQAIYQFRSAVEPLAVSLATQRLTKNAIVRGRSLVEHGRNLVVAGDARATLQADMDFHAFIYELSGNPIIGETMRLHWLHLRRAMGQVLRYPGMSISVWQEHSRILERMIFGDAAGAADLMRRHVVEAYERVRIEPEGA